MSGMLRRKPSKSIETLGDLKSHIMRLRPRDDSPAKDKAGSSDNSTANGKSGSIFRH